MAFDTSWNALLKPGEASRFFDLTLVRPFDVNATGFSTVNAWWLSELSRLVYRRGADEAGEQMPALTRNEILDGAGLREIYFFNTGTAQCAIVESKEELAAKFTVLVFRGTKGFETWLSNLNTIQVFWEQGGQVHAGFKNEFSRIWPEVELVLNDVKTPLFYTGHSLGGALATLAASMIIPCAVYTFGSPRVGDTVFAQSLDYVSIYRVANNRDLVTALPPSRIPFDFCHVGELHHFPLDRASANGEEDIFCDTTDDADGVTEVRCRRRLTDPPQFLADHAPVNYTAQLALRLQNRQTGRLNP